MSVCASYRFNAIHHPRRHSKRQHTEACIGRPVRDVTRAEFARWRWASSWRRRTWWRHLDTEAACLETGWRRPGRRSTPMLSRWCLTALVATSTETSTSASLRQQWLLISRLLASLERSAWRVYTVELEFHGSSFFVASSWHDDATRKMVRWNLNLWDYMVNCNIPYRIRLAWAV